MPVVPSGVGAQVGFAKETTFGTYAAASRFLKLTSSPLERKPDRVQAGGLNAGLLVDEDARYVEVARHAEGSVEGPVMPTGFGLLFQQGFGSAATPAQQGGTAAYLQTHTLVDLYGMSSSWQVGVPSIANQTANPYTMLGAKVKSIEFTQEAKGLLTVKVELWGQDLVESQTLVAATYTGTSEVPYNHAQWACKVGTFGSEAAVVGVRKWSLKIEWKMKDDLDYANSGGLAAQPVTNDRVSVTGSITADNVDKTVWADRFANNTGFSLVNQWIGANIAPTYDRKLTITTPRCRLTGNTPTVGGLDVVSGDFPFEVKYDGTNQPVTLTYQTPDTTL